MELKADTLTFTGQTEKDELTETKHREKTQTSCFKVWFK